MSEKTKEFFKDIETRLIEADSDIEDATEMLGFLRDTGKDVTEMASNLKRAVREQQKMKTEIKRRL